MKIPSKKKNLPHGGPLVILFWNDFFPYGRSGKMQLPFWEGKGAKEAFVRLSATVLSLPVPHHQKLLAKV